MIYVIISFSSPLTWIVLWLYYKWKHEWWILLMCLLFIQMLRLEKSPDPRHGS